MSNDLGASWKEISFASTQLIVCIKASRSGGGWSWRKNQWAGKGLPHRSQLCQFKYKYKYKCKHKLKGECVNRHNQVCNPELDGDLLSVYGCPAIKYLERPWNKQRAQVRQRQRQGQIKRRIQRQRQKHKRRQTPRETLEQGTVQLYQYQQQTVTILFSVMKRWKL